MDEYALNVLKLVASELRLLNGMTAAREMYGKSYFSLRNQVRKSPSIKLSRVWSAATFMP